MNPDRPRIDAWLRLVCLFKHRTEATDACRAGHVRINEQRVKPAATVKVGDLIELYSGERYRRVIVRDIPQSNISKEIARTMYTDETPVREKRESRPAAFRERGSGRPTKRERREIDKWRR